MSGARSVGEEEEPVERGRGDGLPDSVAADLMLMFACSPRRVVADEIGAAARELRGQVSALSMDELLHRLVACRLRRRSAIR